MLKYGMLDVIPYFLVIMCIRKKLSIFTG